MMIQKHSVPALVLLALVACSHQPPLASVSASSAPAAASRIAVGGLPASLTEAPQIYDRFPEAKPNKFQIAAEQPVSTFSADVDTASYAYVRRAIREGARPPVDAVRVEEMVNYFPYAYPKPDSAKAPFKATTTLLPSPWSKEAKLLHIGLKGYDIAQAKRPRLNLVFLIDVSGSMTPRDRLPLVVQSLNLLTDKLGAEDTVGIVTYAGEAGVRLEPTKGAEKSKIHAVLDTLRPGGSTAGQAGIKEAYALARRNFDPKAANRVILATDGDFNVGLSDVRKLEQMISDERKSGVYLTLIGVGTGNLNDRLMQRLAQAGNGNAYYLDSLVEAYKILSEASQALFPIADDVKFQVEFNPRQVAEYRLIGYETRLLARTDFNDDKVDAGEIGSGHTVTAIYEFLPKGAKTLHADPLRYGKSDSARKTVGKHADEVAFLRMRYKLPGESKSQLIEQPVLASTALSSFDAASDDVRFGVAVASFAQKLRNDPAEGDIGYSDIAKMALMAKGNDPDGWRAEFAKLAETAGSLK